MGHWIGDFENAFVPRIGRAYAVAVSSGTSGLHLCVRAAGIGAGDLVITTPFSFVASTNVLLYEQAVPVFVDVDPRDGQHRSASSWPVRRSIWPRAGGAARKWLPRKGVGDTQTLKAILPVDVFGQPADLDPLRQTADQYGIKLIEDACEALGGEYKHRPAGSVGDYSVFAFYPNKQITTGEGGMIVTDDAEAAALMRALRNQGRAPGDTWLQHTHLGYNYRLDEMSAALGTVQMSRLDELLGKRDRVAAWYKARLEKIPGVEPPALESFTTQMSWFVYVVHFDRRNRSGRACEAIGETGDTSPAVLPPDPSAALHRGTLWFPAGRLPEHRGPGSSRASAAVLRHHDRAGRRDRLSCSARGIERRMSPAARSAIDADLGTMNTGIFPPEKRSGLLLHGLLILAAGCRVCMGVLESCRRRGRGPPLSSICCSVFLHSYRFHFWDIGRTPFFAPSTSWIATVSNCAGACATNWSRLGDIEWVRSAKDLMQPIALPTIRLPGAIIGFRRHPDVGVDRVSGQSVAGSAVGGRQGPRFCDLTCAAGRVHGDLCQGGRTREPRGKPNRNRSTPPLSSRMPGKADWCDSCGSPPFS